MSNNTEGQAKPKFAFAEGEVLLIDKPLTWTSFDVVGKLRNSIKPLKVKVGHAGTLDPLATGLLIVCTGKMTKQIDGFQAEDKEYTGTITLGATTPSYDLETEIDQTFDISNIQDEDILNAAAGFVGVQDQYPPAHSAIKIGGERVYEKARRGEEVELKARRVEIMEFEVVKIEMPVVHFRIKCSKGTYIRSLCNDIGERLGLPAHMGFLLRSASGCMKVEDALLFREIEEKIKTLETNIDLVAENCYIKANITSENEALNNRLEKLNQPLKSKIIYDFGEQIVILDPNTYYEWLHETEDGFIIEENFVTEYVDELAKNTNTAYTTRDFNTSNSRIVSVQGPFGYQIDKAAEVKQIISDIESGIETEREPIYTLKGSVRGENDYGNTYVEIDLTNQKVYLYNQTLLVSLL